MLKFLRTYNKIILVFGGVLLMIAFTLPQLPQLFGANPLSQRYATLDGGEVILGRDMNERRQEFSILTGVFRSNPLGFIEDLDHYMMLAYEAEKYGLVGGPDDAATLPRALAPLYAQSFAELSARQGDFSLFLRLQSEREQVIAEYEESLRDLIQSAYNNQATAGAQRVDRALATLRGIMRLERVYAGLPLSSMPEATEFTLELFDEAVADGALVSIGAVEDVSASLTEDQLEAFFERHKNVPPDSGEFGFGYLRPDAVRVEYIVVRRDGIEARVDADRLAVRSFYDSISEEERATLGDFTENRERVLEAFIADRADAIMSDIRAGLRGRLLNARQRVLETRRGEESYYVVTEAWPGERPTLESLERFIMSELPAPAPERVAAGEVPDAVDVFPDTDAYVDVDEVSGAGGPDILRTASLVLGDGRRLTAAEVVLLAIEFQRDDELSVIALARRQLPVQEGVFLTTPLRTPAGDMVFVRITDARPTSPPPSWADVAGRVREDLAAFTAYESLLANGEVLRRAFDEAASLESFAEDEPLVTETAAGLVFSRQRTLTGPNGSPAVAFGDQLLRDAVMDLVADWQPTLDVSTFPVGERTIWVGLPAARSLAIVRVTGRWPANLNDFEAGTARIAGRIRDESSTLVPGGFALSKERSSERLNYEIIQRDN